MSIRFADLRRSLVAAAGALTLSSLALSAAVMPTVAPLTSQPAL
ncbi:hypothetical protein [Sphingomonas sanxanigenens]|uniref:Uncharacterized protein n=1 Tax=Sphingomonas sanxanigenens DSM 19645 = NX02 TaxID=1123269 RepID=W0AEG1_9SPHN|nr:hypothetical protein [Sphingomonas sanxanigenens]AHE56299.1 hypothetical protein NX02_23420 [Sphingomonas sanxanigenens DSM 19645 = NX02]